MPTRSTASGPSGSLTLPSAQARAEAARWAFSLQHAPRGGRSGDVLGRASGASMEFHDRRPYTAGDDVRHIDWRALAKTDEVLVRVHREEVAPQLDLFLDLSRSMATDPSKAQRAMDLAAVLAESARAAGHAVRLVGLGERVERLPVEIFSEGLAFTSPRALSEQLSAAGAEARASSIRAVVSDFLAPVDPSQLLRPFASGSSRALFLQVLSSADIDPAPSGTARLIDAETGDLREVQIDRAALARYRERLQRLRSGLATAARAQGGLFHGASSGTGLESELEALAQLGVLSPA